jgi:TonB family protein
VIEGELISRALACVLNACQRRGLEHVIPPIVAEPAAQIVETTGIVRLDGECLNATITQHFEPYTLGGMAVDRWAVIPFSWTSGVLVRREAEFKVPENNPLPVFLDQDFNVGGPYYPENALKQHAEGVCGMHITVSAEGDVDKILMTRSTGFAALDTACADAMYAAKLVPAQRDGKPAPSTSDVWLAWRLPPTASH